MHELLSWESSYTDADGETKFVHGGGGSGGEKATKLELWGPQNPTASERDGPFPTDSLGVGNLSPGSEKTPLLPAGPRAALLPLAGPGGEWVELSSRVS